MAVRCNIVGASNILLKKLKNEDYMSFKNGHFSCLLSKVEIKTQKKYVFM